MPMTDSTNPSAGRPQLMRANRLLGAALVAAGLVSVEQLEAANERLVELLRENNDRRASLLGVLTRETGALSEEKLLLYQTGAHDIGIVDLRTYDVPGDFRKPADPAACWATWTVPFDHEEDCTFVATAYYLSPAVRDYWEKRLGHILWYAAPLAVITGFLEKTEEAEAADPVPVESTA